MVRGKLEGQIPFSFFFLSPRGGSQARQKKVGVWTRRAAQPTSASQSFQAKEALLSPPTPILLPPHTRHPHTDQPPPRTLCIHHSSLYFPCRHTIQTANRYTNKQRQQSIVPEGVRWVSLATVAPTHYPPFPNWLAIDRTCFRGGKANRSYCPLRWEEWMRVQDVTGAPKEWPQRAAIKSAMSIQSAQQWGWEPSLMFIYQIV